MLGDKEKEMIAELAPAELRERMKNQETFVVNIVASWCPDCNERQAPNFPEFTRKVEGAGIPVFQCCVQHERLIFLSREHEALTNEFGGHGYPRTVLIVKGKLIDSKVEVMDSFALSMLADEYIRKL